jgi:hypothetical protein
LRLPRAARNSLGLLRFHRTNVNLHDRTAICSRCVWAAVSGREKQLRRNRMRPDLALHRCIDPAKVLHFVTVHSSWHSLPGHHFPFRKPLPYSAASSNILSEAQAIRSKKALSQDRKWAP